MVQVAAAAITIRDERSAINKKQVQKMSQSIRRGLHTGRLLC